MQLVPGTVIDDRFELLSVIGSGGMGVVFLAEQSAFERQVALKILRRELCEGNEQVARFEREAQILSKLRHRNIVSVYSFGAHAEHVYMALEYVPAASLQERLQEGTELDADKALSIFRQVCEALVCAHAHSVIHRDLKPSNILVLPDGTVKVIDFGLSKLVQNVATMDQRLTEPGCTVGTVMYMSPEQCLGRDADVRSDIYAAGILLYELLEGDQPFSGDHAVAVMDQHVNASMPKLQIGDQRSAAFDSIIAKATAKDPSQRYQSMTELLDDFDAVSHSVPDPAASHSSTMGQEPAESPSQPMFKLPSFSHLSGPIAGIMIMVMLLFIGDKIIEFNRERHREVQTMSPMDIPLVHRRQLSAQKLQAGEYEAAYQIRKQCCNPHLAGEYGTSLSQLARVCAMTGRYDEALKNYEEWPRHGQFKGYAPQTNAAYLCLAIDRPQQALNYIDPVWKAVRDNPDQVSDIGLIEAEALLRTGQYRQALDVASLALAEATTDEQKSRLNSLRGAAFFALKDYKRAKQHLTISPTGLIPKACLAKLYEMENNDAMAARYRRAAEDDEKESQRNLREEIGIPPSVPLSKFEEDKFRFNKHVLDRFFAAN